MKNKKMLSIPLLIAPVAISPLLVLSAKTNSEDIPFLKDNAEIGNMKIWKMERDNKGRSLEINSYYGVIIFKGSTNSTDNQIVLNNFNVNNNSKITWDKDFDASTEGTYTATINQNGKNNKFKIFVVGSEINDLKFQNVQLPKYFNFPEGVKKISGEFEAKTFEHSILNIDFVFPKTLTDIGKFLFSYAKLNDGFVIPKSVTSIGYAAFSQINKLPEGFKLPKDIEKISEALFWKTHLNDSFVIPNGVKTIEDNAFQEATLNEDFVIPNSVTNMGSGLFTFMSLPEKFKLPKNIKVIHRQMFHHGTLNEDFVIPEGVTSIGLNAFEQAKLNDSFVIPNSVTNIAINAFSKTRYSNKFLGIAKMHAKETIKSLYYPKYDKVQSIIEVKEEAIKEIEAAQNYEEIISVAANNKIGSGIDKMKAVIDNYDKLIEKQSKAINNLPKMPNKDDAKHDLFLFEVVKNVRKNVEDKINQAKTIDDVTILSSSGSPDFDEYTKAIQYYKDSTTELVNAKSTAIGGLPAIPSQDDAAHDESLFPTIKNAIKNLKDKIRKSNSLDNLKDFSTTWKTEIDAYKQSIKAYDASTGITAARSSAMNSLAILPDENDAAHNASLFEAITTVRKDLEDKINASTSLPNLKDFSTTWKTELEDYNQAIKAYDSSTGLTAARLSAIINLPGVPSQDDEAHDTSLFVAIATARINLEDKINKATSLDDVKRFSSAGNVDFDKYEKAIDAYNKSSKATEIKKDSKTSFFKTTIGIITIVLGSLASLIGILFIIKKIIGKKSNIPKNN